MLLPFLGAVMISFSYVLAFYAAIALILLIDQTGRE